MAGLKNLFRRKGTARGGGEKPPGGRSARLRRDG